MATSGSYRMPSLTEAYEQAAAKVRELNETKDPLLEPLEAEDGFPADDFVFYLQLWDELLSSSTAHDSLKYAPVEPGVSHPGDPGSSYWMTQYMLQAVTSAVTVLPGQLRALTDLSGASQFARILESQIEGCIRRARVDYFGDAPQNLRDRIADLVAGLDDRIRAYREGQLDRLTSKAREAVQTAESYAASASSAAGVTGEVVMSKHYDDLATSELTQANHFRALAIGTAVFAALATALFVVGPELNLVWTKIGSTDYVHFFQRVLLVGAFIGVAGYFSRQAHHHRATANWARALAVQLKTFNAFLAPVGNQKLADDMRRDFGARVFGEHPTMRGEPSATPSAAAMDTAATVISKLTAGSK